MLCLCHLSISDMLVGVEAEQDGVLARILSSEGEKDIPFDQPIATYVDNKEAYVEYMQGELAKMRNPEPEVGSTAAPAKELSTRDLLREIKLLINSGVVVDDSGEYRVTGNRSIMWLIRTT